MNPIVHITNPQQIGTEEHIMKIKTYKNNRVEECEEVTMPELYDRIVKGREAHILMCPNMTSTGITIELNMVHSITLDDADLNAFLDYATRRMEEYRGAYHE